MPKIYKNAPDCQTPGCDNDGALHVMGFGDYCQDCYRQLRYHEQRATFRARRMMNEMKQPITEDDKLTPDLIDRFAKKFLEE
jgi:hypothetical protein